MTTRSRRAVLGFVRDGRDPLDPPAVTRARLDEALALDPAHAAALALVARLAGRDAPALG